jgi:hypothetical protein
MQAAVRLEDAVPDAYHQFKQARGVHRPDGLFKQDYFEVADALRIADPNSSFSQKYPSNENLHEDFRSFTVSGRHEDTYYDDLDDFYNATFYDAIENLDKNQNFKFDQKMLRGMGAKRLYDPDLISKKKSMADKLPNFTDKIAERTMSRMSYLSDLKAKIEAKSEDNKELKQRLAEQNAKLESASSAASSAPGRQSLSDKLASNETTKSGDNLSLAHRKNAAELYNISNKTKTMNADNITDFPEAVGAYMKIKSMCEDDNGVANKTPLNAWNEMLAMQKQQREADAQLEKMGGGVSKKKDNDQSEKEHFLMSTFKDAIFICQTLAATIATAASGKADDDNQRITAPTPAPMR